MYKNIYGGLDRQKLQRAANDSRTEHLFTLMNRQTTEEQLDYRDSTEAYLKANFDSKIKNYITDYVKSMDADLKDFIEEYNIDNNIMDCIRDYFPDDEWTEYEEDDFNYWRYYKKLNSALYIKIFIDSDYGLCFSLGVFPYYASFENYKLISVEDINSSLILDRLYSLYTTVTKHDNNKDDFYNFVIDALDLILQSISESFSDAIEAYVKRYPPKLN